MPKKFTKEDFIRQLAIEHPLFELIGDYHGNKKPIIVRCKKHNHIFITTPNRLHAGQGCQKCYDERRGKTQLKTQETFINELHKIYKNKDYDFSKVKYVNSKEKVCLTCKKHGDFYVSPNHIITRHDGCPKCKDEENGKRKRLKIEEFINRAKNVNGEKYDYSKAEYVNVDTPVEIVCPIHGSFFQTPYTHMNGAGCPKCNESRLEKFVESLLFKLDVKFEQQKKFEWLGLQSLDFYLPEYKLAIECQGGQHFKIIEHFGGEESFKNTVKRDVLKNKRCKENGVKIIYVKDDNFRYDIKQAIFEGIYKKVLQKSKLENELKSKFFIKKRLTVTK